MSAMMICTDFGEKWHGGHYYLDRSGFYFFDCESTDNQSFETGQFSGFVNDSNNNSTTAISIKSLFVDKWILQKQFTNNLESSNNVKNFFLFYKSK